MAVIVLFAAFSSCSDDKNDGTDEGVEAKLLTFGFYAEDNSSILSDDYIATLSSTTAKVTMPAFIDKSALVARFTTNDGNIVLVDGVTQVSGATANDFTAPVDYIVSNGKQNVKYTITVAKSSNMAWVRMPDFTATSVFSGSVLKINPVDQVPYLGFKLKEEEKMALAGFQWSCYSNDPIVPADSTLSLFYTGILDGNLSGAHTAYFQSQADEAKAMLRVEQSHFFPEISVGYTRQDILPLKNLNAWMIGVSFPIYFLPQKSKVKQARLTATSAQIQADANIRELRNKTLELEASLRRNNESLRYYTSSALKEADELTKAANLQLQQSETGIAEYIQSITTAREIRRGYIETVYQYNIAALEYELFK